MGLRCESIPKICFSWLATLFAWIDHSSYIMNLQGARTSKFS